MKRALTAAIAIMLFLLASCSGTDDSHKSPVPEQKPDNTEEAAEMRDMEMLINGEKVDVTWEDNGSVKALSELAAKEPLVIDTSLYGGFEQVGSIGTDLPSNDVSMTTEPGDIVLYTGSNIVVFFGSNSWSYTKLGHIENKSEDELTELLGGNDVEIILQ